MTYCKTCDQPVLVCTCHPDNQNHLTTEELFREEIKAQNKMKDNKRMQTRTRIISISGLANSGKTTMVRKLANFLIQQDKSVLVMPEIARKYIHIENKQAFQTRIASDEMMRLSHLRKLPSTIDFVIVDRTCYDQIAYIRHDAHYGKEYALEVETDNVYDLVFFFGDQLKQTSNENFTYHDQDYIRNAMLRALEPTCLHIMGNSVVNELDVIETVSKLYLR